MDLFSALTASAIHRAQKSLEWVDEDSVGRKITKHYTVFVALLSRTEFERMTGSSYADDDYYKLDFTGDVAPQIRQIYESRRDERLSLAAQAILDTSMRQLMQHPMGYSGMRESFFQWGIDVRDGWSPLPVSAQCETAKFELNPAWDMLSGPTIGVAELKHGEIKSNHRMFPWMPWPPSVEHFWDAFKAVNPDCQRAVGELKTRPWSLTKPRMSYIQALFTSKQDKAVVEIFYGYKGPDRVVITLTAPTRAHIDALLAIANKSGDCVLRELH